jgi:hypothetical protein
MIDNSQNNADVEMKLFIGCYEPSDGSGDDDDPRNRMNRYRQVVALLEAAGYDIEYSYKDLWYR